MANTLAYYDTATITAVKSFIVQAPNVLGLSMCEAKDFDHLRNKTK
jgi:hypothetical protein